MLKLTQPAIWPLVLLIAANGLILARTPPGLRYVAALILLTFLPGRVWLQTFFARPADIAERIIFSVGLSLALTLFGAMFTVYLPGPLTTGHLLITFNVITIGGLLLTWLRQRHPTPPISQPSNLPNPVAQRRPLLILALLLLLAAALRLPRLGYAEFHEDEAEALMLGVRLLQGEDYALFLHRKGPAQMLVPVTFWLLTGRISETMARFPFALSSIFSVATIFIMGRRWFNWQAGAVAGLLWAINGFAIAFGRMAQYQALIFFLGPLAIYSLYLAWKYHQPRLQILAALLLAACLLAHFDALLLLPVAGYLGWVNKRRGAGEQGSRGEEEHSSLQRFHLIVALSVTLFLALLASFYVPYLLDPEFQHTIDYLSQTRIKPGLLYNNLDLLQRLNKEYSSHFYLPVLALGIIGFFIWQSVPLSRKWRWIMLGLGLLAASTVWLPNFWRVGSLSLAVLPWLLLGLFGFRLFAQIELKVTWLMFGAAFIGYVFLVDDPRTHFYMMYLGAVLLAGAGLNYLRCWIYDSVPFGYLRSVHQTALRTSQFTIRTFAIRTFASVVAVGVALIVTYEAAIFLQTESAFTELQSRWEDSIWETMYDELPKARGYFGYPKREGWKAIGALRNQGKFPGDFRSMNEDFIIPIWYNYGRARSCYTTPAQYFVRSTGGSVPIDYEQYGEVGRVWREGQVRLRIFSAGTPTPTAPIIYPLETLEAQFDQLATPEQFTRQAEPAQAVGTQFGPAIRFVGYDLPTNTVAQGDILHLNLYWQATKRPADNYRAFVHLTDGTTLWGQQDDDPACRLPTTIWRAGQRGMGQFRLSIDPATPPGRYPLIIGLYQADTLERLRITAGAGKPGDDFLWLGDIEVVKSN